MISPAKNKQGQLFANTSILVVEDSKSQAADLAYKLTKNGAAVEMAENGILAVRILEKKSFDLIISDVVMPEMDGYELAKWVKSNEKIKPTPFILLTSLTDPAEIIKGLECGADSFLTKPYNEEFLTKKILYLIENFRLRREHKSDNEIQVFFDGKQHIITADRLRIIDLLFSTYENAVLKSNELIKVNKELTLAQAKLKMMNENLERMVDQRTKQLADSETLYRTIFEHAARLILSIDHNGIIVDCNKRVESLLSYTNEELIGQKISSIMIQDGNQSLHSLYGKKSDEENSSFECLFKKKYGQTVEVAVNKSSISTRESEHALEIWIVEDISLRKIWERELIDAKEKAEESDSLKLAFIANMSHDLKTPLNSIADYSEFMEQSEISFEQVKEFAKVINSSSQNLLGIINDILDVSKIQTGQVTLNEEITSLNTILFDNISACEELLNGKKLDFIHTEVNPAEDIRILTDKYRVNQILSNLLSNAFKFTNKGKVIFKWQIKAKEIIFTISDTGTGIKPENLEAIFEPFSQVSGSASKNPDGNGLGLATSKLLAELMNGSITVSSEPGKGSEFIFRLPIKKS